MGISFDKTKISGSFPPFWRGDVKVLPGDFRIKQIFAEGTLLKAGTPIAVDFDNMECGVVKVAKVLAGGTTTIPRVSKGTLLKVGDIVAKVGKLDLSVSITDISTANADYDVITLSGAMTTLATGDFLVESATYAVGVTESAPLYIANAVIETTKEYTAKGFQTVSAGYDALVLKEVVYPIPASWLTGFALTNNQSIKYIKQ